MYNVRRILLKSSSAGETSPDHGIVLGRALAMDHRKIIVARDLMKSSSMMSEAIISGLLFQGADVVDIGVVSLPAAAMAASKADCTVYIAGRTGMMSGYFLLNPDGSMFKDSQLRHLDLVFHKPPEAPDHDSLGNYMHRDGVTEDYNRYMTSQLSKGIVCSVIVDCNCGTTSDSIPQILNGMGADVFAFNTHRDPNYRPFMMAADEDSDNALESLVKNSPGTIGLRMNGTGTAVEVIDESGNLLSNDQVFAMLVSYLRPKSIAIPVDSSSLIVDAYNRELNLDLETPFEDEGHEEIVMTVDNASAVCEAVASGVELGYHHGSIVYNSGAALGDGIRTAAFITQLSANNSLRRLVGSFPEYLRESKTYECQMRGDAFRHALDENIGPLADRCTQYGDAYRIQMEKGWFMIRHTTSQKGDNTVEVLAESKDRAYLVGLMEIGDEIVARILRNE